MTSPNDAKISHILGIDFGAAKIGLALADSETRMAFGYYSLLNNKELITKIAEIIEKENIGTVVIGLPSYNNVPESQKIYFAFGDSLKMTMPTVEIAYADEMFTTKMAQDNLKAKGMRHVKDHDHKEAARIILQSWLDKSWGMEHGA